MRAIIVGFGNVGREVIKQAREMGAGIRFVGALSSKGGVIVKESGDEKELIKVAEAGQKLEKHGSFTKGISLRELVEATNPDIAFVAIPPSYVSGDPNRVIYNKLADMGVSAVTADKTALALDFWATLEAFTRRGLRLGYRATVAAGVPVTDVAWALRWRGVEGFEAVLNATTNYIISLIAAGMTYEEAVKRAIDEGYAEPDPTVDTHGWDPAAKAAIVASILEGMSVSIGDVVREPLGEGVSELVRAAKKEGAVLRYVAVYTRGGEVRVKPLPLPRHSPLAGVSGTYNAVVLRLEGEEVTLSGPAGPAWRTARVMIGDALDIAGGSE